jgi:predicted nucleotide-binding protein
MSVSQDLFNQINNAVLDLQAAQLQSYHTPLKRLARLLRHPDLQKVNQKITRECDLENFLGNQAKRGGMVGSERLEWPDDPEKILGLTLLLIEKFAADPDEMVQFGYVYFYSGNTIIDNINAVTGQVIIPFVRDYKSYVQAFIANEGEAADTRLTIATNQKVFVVHGHDAGAREGVARFLQSIEVEPVILLEQANSGQTIIQKFESHAAAVSFAVILLTPDDLGGAAGSDQAQRARQNVIYELGYFTGKLGRGRTCLLRKGNVDIPSDLAGIVYTELDEAEGWKLKLIRELKAAGFNIDANKAMKY